jgi:TetR/AcrR family macrolide resistance operon transcriptional repressor
MARQQRATDDQILQSALRVMVRRGHEAFTLSEVAGEVGLSRAAIILRFKSTQGLRVALTTYIAELFIHSLRSLPVSRNGDGLLALVAYIGRLLPNPGSLTAFMRSYHANINDKELIALEHKRGDALRAAISERMPALAIAHDSAVIAFGAHITGSLLQWEVSADASDNARAYLVERTKAWLSLAQIPYDAHFSGD